MGNQKRELKLEKFRVTKIKNSNEIFGGVAGGGENPVCSVLQTTTKTKDKGNQLLP